MIIQNLFDGVFRDKTVFVTGHTGFIGSWLSLWLHSLGAKVVGYALEPSTSPSLFDTLELQKFIYHIIGDVRDVGHLHDSLSKHQPEFVFSLAAQPLVRLSYEKPIETFQTNIMGTVNLLESIRTISSVRTCVVMTSDKCYENREGVHAYKESDPMGGYDPYSASKGAAELVTASYRNSFFNTSEIEKHKVSVSTIRAGNVIGGGDWSTDRIIPDCIRALTSKKSILVRHPNAIRPWQHVFEPISGMLCLAMKMYKTPTKFSEAWNFGPLSNNQNTVKDLVDKVIQEWGEGNWLDISKQTENDKHESNLLRLDSAKAMDLLEWQPVYLLDKAIAETISWYRSYTNRNSTIKEFSLKQIQNYIDTAKQMNIAWASNNL